MQMAGVSVPPEKDALGFENGSMSASMDGSTYPSMVSAVATNNSAPAEQSTSAGVVVSNKSGCWTDVRMQISDKKREDFCFENTENVDWSFVKNSNKMDEWLSKSYTGTLMAFPRAGAGRDDGAGKHCSVVCMLPFEANDLTLCNVRAQSSRRSTCCARTNREKTLENCDGSGP